MRVRQGECIALARCEKALQGFCQIIMIASVSFCAQTAVLSVLTHQSLPPESDQVAQGVGLPYSNPCLTRLVEVNGVSASPSKWTIA